MTKLFLSELQDWYETNKSNIPDALTATEQAYNPSESDYAFRVLATIQRLSESGKGLRFKTKDGRTGSVWNHGREHIDGILDENRERGWNAPTRLAFTSVTEFWLDLRAGDRA